MKRSNTSKILNEWKSFLNENEKYYADSPKSSWDSGPHDVADLVDRLFAGMELGDILMRKQQFDLIEEAFMMLEEKQLEMLLQKYSPEGTETQGMALENDPDMGA